MSSCTKILIFSFSSSFSVTRYRFLLWISILYNSLVSPHLIFFALQPFHMTLFICYLHFPLYPIYHATSDSSWQHNLVISHLKVVLVLNNTHTSYFLLIFARLNIPTHFSSFFPLLFLSALVQNAYMIQMHLHHL